MTKRALKRRKRIVANIAKNYAQAEQWDLEFWLNQTPQQRLSALVAIRNDVHKVQRAKSLHTQKVEPR